MDCSHIQFSVDKSKVDYQQLRDLFTMAAFWARERNIEDLEIAITNSDPVVTIWDRSKLIGFSRATSDGIYRAGIWDVVVHPQYRGMGLGRKLVETVIAHPKVNKVERIYLTTTHQQSFYERIGFKRNDTTTMVLYNTNPMDSIALLEHQTQEITVN
jgi:ribosomal protein S18 acetylase RimI-like enzyme